MVRFGPFLVFFFVLNCIHFKFLVKCYKESLWNETVYLQCSSSWNEIPSFLSHLTAIYANLPNLPKSKQSMWVTIRNLGREKAFHHRCSKTWEHEVPEGGLIRHPCCSECDLSQRHRHLSGSKLEIQHLSPHSDLILQDYRIPKKFTSRLKSRSPGRAQSLSPRAECCSHWRCSLRLSRQDGSHHQHKETASLGEPCTSNSNM